MSLSPIAVGRALPAPRRELPARPARAIALPNATLLARIDLTDSLADFLLLLDSPLAPFLPGQYVSVGVIDGTGLVQRPYSVVSLDTGRRRVELFVRRIPGGSLSSRLWDLPAGARVRVGPARGMFTLDPADRRRLFVATGTGLAPFLAMLEASLSRGDGVTTTLIHAASHADELAHADRLAGWVAGGLPLDYRPTVSRPDEPRSAGWAGLAGRADAVLERMLAGSELVVGTTRAYLCGNPSMIEACSRLLAGAGFAPADIRIEQFHAPVGASQPP
jgi:ferredoxin-NADP reductase